MEMTINKAMEILTAEDFNGYSMSEIIEARNMTLDIMQKYQKIVDIVSLDGEEFKQCGLKELKEVLEVIADGTINSSDCV